MISYKGNFSAASHCKNSLMSTPGKKRGFSHDEKMARLLKRPLFVVFGYIKSNGRIKVNKQKKPL